MKINRKLYISSLLINIMIKRGLNKASFKLGGGDWSFQKISFLAVVVLVGLGFVKGVDATTYYVDATIGNDNNTGTSQDQAWKTISKVNSSSCSAGDSILFKNGGVWRETLTIPCSGSDGSPITIGTYGSSQLAGSPIRHKSNPLVRKDFMFRSIVKVDNVYHAFEEVITNPEGVWSIHKRTSSDGLHWSFRGSALFSLGGAGEFDEKGQADPTVVYDGVNDWKMWFDALDGNGVFGEYLGYATSTDGTNWTKYGTVLERSASGWDSLWVHHPSVVKVNGTYYMYYAGKEAGGNYQVGLATSTNGINWTKYSGSPVISKGSSGEWDDDYIRPSHPFIINGIWHMLYWGFDGSDSHLGLATSPDGYSWTKHGKFFEGESGEWDNNTQGNDVIIENGTVKIWYTGKSITIEYGTSYGVGLSTIEITAGNSAKISGVDVTGPWTTTGLSAYGDTSSSPPGGYSGDYVYFHKIPVSSEITPDAIKVFIAKTDIPYGAYHIKGNIYDDDSGSPGSPVTNGETEEKEFSEVLGDEWTIFNFLSSPTLSAGDYWIAIWSDSGYKRAKGSGGSNNWYWDSETYGDTWPDPAVPESPLGYSDFDAYIVDTRANVWQIDLATEPNIVSFDGEKGNKQAAINDVDSKYDWFWESNILYVYSDSDPNVKYVNPGIGVANRDYCINTNSKNYITVDDIELKGGKVSNILISGANSILKYSDIYYSNAIGIQITGNDNDIYYNLIYSNEDDGLTISGTGGEIYNNVLYGSGGAGLDIDESSTIKNNIVRNSTADDINIASGKTVTGGYNYFEDSAKAGDGTYTDTSSSTLWNTDPLFTDAANNDFTLQATSPAIDAGTDVSLTEDYRGYFVAQGNAPDIGAYEYLNVTYTTFDGDTTDLATIDTSNISNLIIEKSSYGKINFSESVNLSGGADLNTHVNISHNRIEVNSSALPALNKSATLILYNLTFTDPRILRSGSVCSSTICTKINYSGGKLIFNVTSFSAYSAEETPTTIEEPPLSVSGGGYPTFKPSQEQLKEVYEKSLRKNWKITFEFNNKSHTVKLDGIVNKTAIITISSEPVTFNLTLNETKKLNLDDDEYYDLEVFLKDISDYRADLVLKLIHEEIPKCEPNWECTEWSGCVSNIQTRICTDLNDCNVTEARPDEVQECEPKTDYIAIVIVSALIAAAVIAGFLVRKQLIKRKLKRSHFC